MVRKFKMPRDSKTKECYKRMKEVTHKDYLEFIKENDSVVIEDVKIKLQKKWKIKSYGPPKDYTPERTTAIGVDINFDAVIVRTTNGGTKIVQ